MTEDIINIAGELKKAIAYHQSGQIKEAQSIYIKIIDIDANNPDALHLLGFLSYQQGNFEKAEILIKKAIKNSPGNGLYFNNLGLVFKDQGRREESIGCFQMAINFAPNMVEAINNLGIALEESGNLSEAVNTFRKALTIDSSRCETYNNLGNALKNQGSFDKALNCINQAIEINPNYAEAYNNKGTILQEQDHSDEAILYFKKAIELNPSITSFHINLGNILRKTGSPKEALTHLKKALQLEPNNADIYYKQGKTFQDLKEYKVAASCYQKAITLEPEDAENYAAIGDLLLEEMSPDKALPHYERAIQLDPQNTRALAQTGLIFNRLGNISESVKCYEKVLKIEPDFAEAHNNLGVLYQQNKDIKKAKICFEKAINLKSDYADPLFNMGTLYHGEGKYCEGLACFDKALQVDKNYAKAKWMYHLSLPILYNNKDEIHYYRKQFSEGLEKLTVESSLKSDKEKNEALSVVSTATNFYLQYQGENDLILQKKYGDFVCRVMASNFPKWSVKKEMPPLKNGEKIRIGYVSSLMLTHTIGVFLMGWIENMNRKDFEIYCYYIDKKSDEMTEKYREKSDHFYQIEGNLEAMAKQIESDNLHILVFSDIGMYAPATQLAALRLAPIQCKGWGHPVTTGLPTINYYLSSDLMEPENGEEHYSEKLIRLPNLALAYEKPQMPKEPRSRHDFGIAEDAFVYFTPQSLFKYLPQYDLIYPQIAKAVPKAIFVFLSSPSDSVTQDLKIRLARAFEKEGLSSDKYLSFQPRMKFNDFLSLNLASDVILDTMAWSGGKTTLEGLSCGLPVVTMPGRFMRGRHAYAMLKMIDVMETVAESLNDYVEIASKLGNDKTFLMMIKKRIIDNQHRLYNDHIFINALEKFYKDTIHLVRR